MSKMKCYFAHPTNRQHSKEKKEIIKFIETEMGLEVIDPFKNQEEYWLDPAYKKGRKLWTDDLKWLKESHFLVAWCPDWNTLGVTAEIATAYETRRIYIIIISPILHPCFALYANDFYINVKDFMRRKKYKWKN